MKKATKEILLKKGEELILKSGYYETKVEDITKEAGVAKGTFYIYFSSKEDIFIEILKGKIAKAVESMREKKEEVTDFRKKMDIATEEYIKLHIDNLGFLRVIFSMEKEKKNSKFMNNLMELHKMKLEVVISVFKNAVENREITVKYKDRIEDIAIMYDIMRTEYIFHKLIKLKMEEGNGESPERGFCDFANIDTDSIKNKIDARREAELINDIFFNGIIA